MVKFYRGSASLSALWLSKNDRLSDFYALSWQRGDSVLPLLVLRILFASGALGILVWSLVEGASPYWPIYLTNWGVLLVALTTLSGVVVSVIFCFKKPPETTELPWFVSMYWLLFNVTVSIAVMIVALYWILLYQPGFHDLGSRAFWLDVTTHGLAASIIFCELLVARTPIRLAHIYQPLSVGLWYAVFSAIYYAAGGTDAFGNRYIYAVLDWANGWNATIVVLGSVVALIVLYLIEWGLAYCRDKISMTCIRTKGHDLEIDHSSPPRGINVI